MTARLVGAATAAVMLLALSACTDEPSDDPTAPSFAPAPSTSTPVESDAPSGSPSAATSVPPSVDALAPPALPDVAMQESSAGAVAFTEWWFDALNFATITGETAVLRDTFTTNCRTCENFVTQIDGAYGSGGSISGGHIRVRADVPTVLQEGGVTLAVQVEAEAGQVRDSDGEVLEELGAESLASAVAVLWEQERWVMGGIQ